MEEGFINQTNIDFSNSVVKQMQQHYLLKGIHIQCNRII